MSEINELNEMIEKEEQKYKSLEKKRIEIEDKIKKCKSTIEQYKLMRDQNMLKEFNSVLQTAGVSFNEVLSALKNGDLFSLQEKMKQVNNDME